MADTQVKDYITANNGPDSNTPVTTPKDAPFPMTSDKPTISEMAAKKDEPASKNSSVTEFKGAQKKTQADLDALMAKGPESPGPKPTEPTQQNTDPWQTFGSPAMIVASLASLFSRAPLTSALNAGGEVMKAQANKDAAAYQQAMDKFKTSMEQYWKLADYEKDVWKTAIEVDKDKLSSIAAAFKDEAYVKLSEAQGQEAAIQGKLKQFEFQDKMKEAQDKINVKADTIDALPANATDAQKQVAYQKYGERIRALKGEAPTSKQDTPTTMKEKEMDREYAAWEDAHKNATAAEKNAARTKIYKDVGSSALSGTAQQKIQQRDQGIDNAIESIDKAMALAKQYSGAKGYLERGKETVYDITNTKQNSPRPQADFESTIRELRATVPQLVGMNSRTSKDQRENLNKMLAGIELGSTGKRTQVDLEDVKKMLLSVKGKPSGYDSLEDLVKAHQNGEITAEEARQISTENGWAE